MRKLTKRSLVKRTALASQLQPGESVQLEDSPTPLVLTRQKLPRLSAQQIERDLAALAQGIEPMDADALLEDLRS